MKYIRADLFMNKIAGSAFFSAAEKGKIRAAIEKELGEDVKPVVHAHWELAPEDTAYDNVWICSNCGEDFTQHRKFCTRSGTSKKRSRRSGIASMSWRCLCFPARCATT